MARIEIIGVPMDLGASRRGVDMGPSALRIARLGPRLRSLGHDVVDGGNVEVRIAESQAEGGARHKFLDPIVEACWRISSEVYRVLQEGRIPLVLGGDHSIAIGTLGGVSRFHRERRDRVGVLWLDAHGDVNTPETSPSGNVHGMPLAVALGRGAEELRRVGGDGPMVSPEHTAIVGVRELDPGERQLVKELGVHVFTMRDIDERSLSAVMAEALAIVSNGTAGYHVSLDLDWLDPKEAPGVGTPVLGGATYREGHLAMELIADHGRMRSLEVVEVNPVLDERNKTADLATQFVLSAFGKHIL